jgi:hypothetical protein
MFLGHYAVALAAKRAAPGTSLGTLVLGVQFLDLLWPILLLLGLERVRVVPGLMAANSLDFVHYPISHSLVTATLWALLVGGVYYVVRRYAAGAWVVGAAVLSHWFLDVPMHRPDLPLSPGSTVMVGGGLWDSVAATLTIEIGLLALGMVLYLRATRAIDRIGRWGVWGMAALLVSFFLTGTLGPPPPSEGALAVGGLGMWLFVPLAYWVDRHRVAVSMSGSAAREMHQAAVAVR